VRRLKSDSTAVKKQLQHKSLLPFASKKVIVAKEELCSNVLGDHKTASVL
jgi:hypothetical protein